METHFLKRHKCPKNFELIGKSIPRNKVRRGGVAVYKKCKSEIKVCVFDNICPDTVVFSVESTNVIFIAPYITPENSKYKVPHIFSILENIIKSFNNYRVFLIGDLNSRCGNSITRNLQYLPNVDPIVNSHGRKLNKLCIDNEMIIVNGLKYKSKSFDSNFTFFRGNVKSQNDWCVTNFIDGVVSFSIIPKSIISDHCPLSLKICIPKSVTLSFIDDVSAGTFTYDQYDRSKLIKRKLRLEDINTNNLVERFDEIADYISQMLYTKTIDTNNLSTVVNNKIYNACSYKKNDQRTRIPEDKKHLNSHNFRAIANANLRMYDISLQRGDNLEQSKVYYKTWENSMAYLAVKEYEEYNAKVNTTWQFASKSDPKKLWKMIDYNDNESKDKSASTCNVDENIIHNYFTSIFQAEKIGRNPTVVDIRNSLDVYCMYVPILDDDFTFEELSYAIQNNGRGTGLDSIDKRTAVLFTMKLRESILNLFNTIFSTQYPVEWTKQLLRPEKKKGHTQNDPKLRGIAITQLLPTLYDIILFNRFNLWYSPNSEQAGFRPKQGCLLQIFAIYVVMEFLKSIGKHLYVGFLDYEKAFDFINRAHIINHLKEKGAGTKFVKAVASMYNETFYIPKLGNRMGKSILAKHGVTQGRQSSTSFFSFEIQDMARSIEIPNSKLNGYNLLQLADDTALLAEERFFLRTQFIQCLKFSKDSYMFANTNKTVFLHLSEDPDIEPLDLDGNVVINPADNNEYVYLGMKFVASNDIIKHIKKNLQDRMYNINKFYDWLHVNEFTPVKVKLQVLYTCMFSAYLYGVETWWKIDDVSKQLLLLERKLLKCILCVKNNTPDDILYLELNKPDIIATVKSRQYSFYSKLLMLQDTDAVSRKILTLHRQLPICRYYDDLDQYSTNCNKSKRYHDLQNATSTYLKRYYQLIDIRYNHVIYDSFLPENLRIIITRWRLSNHQLRIETGRQEITFLQRNLRTCANCQILEDEQHVIFQCPLYEKIRLRYVDYMQNYTLIETFFNPTSRDDALLLGNFLSEIESCREALGLQ